MRQSYEKNLEDLNAFPWENFMKLITGPTMKQWLLNWMDSFAEGKLSDGKSIEDAITSIGQSVNSLNQKFTDQNSSIESILTSITDVNNEIAKLWTAIVQNGGDPGENPQIYTFSPFFSLVESYVDLASHYLALPRVENPTLLDTASFGVYTHAAYPSFSAFLNYNKVLQLNNNADYYLSGGEYSPEISFPLFYFENLMIPKNNNVKVMFKAHFLNASGNFEPLQFRTSISHHSVNPSVTLSYCEIATYDWDNYSFIVSFSDIEGLDADKLAIHIIAENGGTIPAGVVVEIKDFSVAYYPDSSIISEGLKLPVSNLVLSIPGDVPVLPAKNITPDDDSFDETTHIMPGQMAYNSYDDLWFYNTGTKIKTLLSKFSEQFKTIDNVVHWDPNIIKAKYKGESYVIDTITANSDITLPIYAPLANIILQGNRVKKLTLEMRVVNNNSIIHEDGSFAVHVDSSNNAFQGPELSNDFQVYEWENSSYLMNITTLSFGLRSNVSDNVWIGSGSVFEIRNVVVTDNSDNTYTAEITPADSFSSTQETIEIQTPLSGTRVLPLILTQPGQKPTLPAAGVEPGDQEWKDTDLMKGEIPCYNSADDIWYYNNGTEIKSFVGGVTVEVDEVPTKGSSKAVSSGGVYKTIKQTFVVESTTDYGVIGYDEAFKISSIVADSGLTVTVKKSDDTDYTVGDTVAAFDFLKVYGDTLNKLFTVKGEIV